MAKSVLRRLTRAGVKVLANSGYVTTPPPVIDSMNYSQGDPLGGGQSIVLTGTGFTSGTPYVDGTPVGSFTVDSDLQITFTLPAHAAGSVGVTVVGPGGTSSAIPFTYWGPSSATSATAMHRWRPDLGVTLSGTGQADIVADQIGTLHMTQVASVWEPKWNATDADFGGMASLSRDMINGTTGWYYDIATKGTNLQSPISLLLIVRSVTDGANMGLSGSAGTSHNLLWRPSGVDPGTIAFYAGASVTGNRTSSKDPILFTDDPVAGTSLYLNSFTAAAGTGGTLWVSTPNFSIAHPSAGTTYFDGQFAECVMWSGVLDATDRTKLRAYILQRYGY